MVQGVIGIDGEDFMCSGVRIRGEDALVGSTDVVGRMRSEV